MMMRHRQHRPASAAQRGAAVVELAIALPVLLFLMLAVTEVGRILFQYNTLTKANRDATRFLANNATLGSTDVILITPVVAQRTSNLAVYGNINGTGQPLLDGLSTGDVKVFAVDTVHVRVSMTYSYQPLFGATLPSFGIGDGTAMNIDMASSVVMRAL